MIPHSNLLLRVTVIWAQQLASKLANKVQAGTVKVAERRVTNIVYRKTVALEPIIIRDAGAATRL
jgi:hypothetical protein